MGLRLAPRVAFLLPVTFLCGARRARDRYSRGLLVSVAMIAPRPKFAGPTITKDQSAVAEYGWFVFGRPGVHSGDPGLHWLSWAP